MTEEQGIVGAQTNPAPAQNMLSQDEVNIAIGHAKREAAERTRRQMELEQQQAAQAQQAQQAQQLQQDQQQTGQPELSSHEMMEKLREEMRIERQQEQAKQEQQLMQQQMQSVAEGYENNLNDARGRYEDFDQIMNGFNPSEFPELILELDKNPRGGDILYELWKNPKMMQDVNSSLKHTPSLGRKFLAELDGSVNTNQQAMSDYKRKSVPEPLDSLSPSRAQGSNGEPSVEDFMGMDWLKG